MDAELGPRHRRIATNGIHLHAVEAGPEGGPLLILLHGFPEPWFAWRHQIAPLAAAGYHVVAPDQRGYNLSDKPARIADYDLETLARDVVGLIDEAGEERACVVGHDWGGAVGWWLGVRHPERLHKLALLNIPHPWVLERTLRSSSAQRRKSSYIFFFQLPWLPERSFRASRFALAVKSLQGSSRPGTFSDPDLERYRQAWSQPGAVRSMIHWYRAALALASRVAGLAPRPRAHPAALGPQGPLPRRGDGLQPSVDLCDEGRLELFGTRRATGSSTKSRSG